MRWAALLLLIPVACVSSNQARGAGQGDSMTIEFTGKSREEACREILQLVRRAYVEENINAFMAWVSRDYARDYTLLREAITRDVRNFDVVALDLWIDRTVSSDKDRIFDCRWEKRYDDRATGQRVTSRGSTSFIFRDERDGYRLYDMRGDLIFGQSSPELGQMADLSVESVDADTATEVLIVMAVIKNRGGAAAQNVRVRLRYTQANPPPEDKFVTLKPGESATLQWGPFFIPIEGTATVTVDSDNRIVETDEFNNEKSDNYGF